MKDQSGANRIRNEHIDPSIEFPPEADPDKKNKESVPAPQAKRERPKALPRPDKIKGFNDAHTTSYDTPPPYITKSFNAIIGATTSEALQRELESGRLDALERDIALQIKQEQEHITNRKNAAEGAAAHAPAEQRDAIAEDHEIAIHLLEKKIQTLQQMGVQLDDKQKELGLLQDIDVMDNEETLPPPLPRDNVIPIDRRKSPKRKKTFRERMRNFAGVAAFMSMFGADKSPAQSSPSQVENPTGREHTVDTRASGEAVHSGHETKVNADFSDVATAEETYTSPQKVAGEDSNPEEHPEATEHNEAEEEEEIIGNYTLKKGEGFYRGAKNALKDAFEQLGNNKDLVLSQIALEYDLGNMDTTDPEKVMEIWAEKQGESPDFNIRMNKGGGYDFGSTFFPGNIFHVNIQPLESAFAPRVQVEGYKKHGIQTHEPASKSSAETETALASFDVGDEETKRTFAAGDTVTYQTIKQKKAEEPGTSYKVKGPSADGGLILTSDSGTEFAVSSKGLGRVTGGEPVPYENAGYKKLDKDEEPPNRIVTAAVQTPDKGPETFLDPAMKARYDAALEKKQKAPAEKSGFKTIDLSDTKRIDVPTVTSGPKEAEQRVRVEDDPVEDLLLVDGKVPTDNSERTKALVAWHDLSLKIDTSFLGDEDGASSAKKEIATLTANLLSKGGPKGPVNTQRVFESIQHRIEAVQLAQKAGKRTFGKLFSRFLGKKEEAPSKRLLEAIREEVKTADDHFSPKEKVAQQ